MNLSDDIAASMNLRMADALPDLAIAATNLNFDVHYANAYAIEVFKLDTHQIESGEETLPISISQHIARELSHHNTEFTLQHTSLGKTYLLKADISHLLSKKGEHVGYILQLRDITEQTAAENHLREQGNLLDALISCDQLLHTAESWQDIATQVLELLCQGSRFNHATLLQNTQINNDADVQSTRLLHWSEPTSINLGEAFTVINYEADGCGRWLGLLQQGNPVYGVCNDMPAQERKFLQHHSAKSIVITPVFSGDIWWGIIVLERCDEQPEVSSYELAVLMAISRSLGVAILRESAGKRLHEAKIAFDNATEGMMIVDQNMHITAINKGYTEITGYSEQDVLGRTPKIFQPGPLDLRDTLLLEEKWRGEISHVRKNGEPYQAWLTATVIKDHEDRIINYVIVFSDITESKSSQSHLHKLVNHDTLTGLPNRRLLNELMEQAIKRAGREESQLALLFIDLDRFKAINDTLGHQVGDKLLYEVSRRISCAIRDSDVAARLGGDEFVVVMDILINTEDAATVAKKIIQALQVEFVIDGREIFIGASVGISVFPKDGVDVDSLIKAADIAMYHVKNSGKNNHCFYSDDLSEHAVERFTMENHLRRALEREQFVIYYQPQISLFTGQIIGAEALIRWIHPDLGMVSPATFIPLAEEIGIIVQIGEWVLRQSALQINRWLEDGYAIQWVAVNVSGIQVMRSNFADTVYGILIETDCNPDMIELEITESTIMHNTEYVIDTFNRIRKLGVKLAIDDFGTGYSSLSHLKRLPLDKLKIDQSFVHDLPDDQNDAAIAKAINAMARSLGFSVIAEGVETEEQADFLREIGCEEAQGYLYSKPVPAADFTELLQKDKLKYNN